MAAHRTLPSATPSASSSCLTVRLQLGDTVFHLCRSTLMDRLAHARLGGTHLLAAMMEHEDALTASRDADGAYHVDACPLLFQEHWLPLLRSCYSPAAQLVFHDKLRSLASIPLAHLLDSASYLGLAHPADLIARQLHRRFNSLRSSPNMLPVGTADCGLQRSACRGAQPATAVLCGWVRADGGCGRESPDAAGTAGSSASTSCSSASMLATVDAAAGCTSRLYAEFLFASSLATPLNASVSVFAPPVSDADYWAALADGCQVVTSGVPPDKPASTPGVTYACATGKVVAHVAASGGEVSPPSIGVGPGMLAGGDIMMGARHGGGVAAAAAVAAVAGGGGGGGEGGADLPGADAAAAPRVCPPIVAGRYLGVLVDMSCRTVQFYVDRVAVGHAVDVSADERVCRGVLVAVTLRNAGDCVATVCDGWEPSRCARTA